MKLKELESVLQRLDVFETPNIALEQYATTPHVAACLVNIVKDFGEIEGKIIGDLGCGCGVLSIGAALFGAGLSIGFDIDENALEISNRNKDEVECENVDFIQCDALTLGESRWIKVFDTIIMNPPFGTKDNKGMDMLFLKTALSLSRQSVYSLHKSSTIEHIEKVAQSWNVKMESLYKLKYELPMSYKRHRVKSKDIEVHLLRFTFPKWNKKS